MAELVELTNAELEKLGYIQYQVNARYMGKPKDLKILQRLCDEMKERCYDAGFIVEMMPTVDKMGNWVPQCSVVGRVDSVEFDPERLVAEGGKVL